MTEPVTMEDIKHRESLRHLNQIFLRHRFTGIASCFRTWTGMVLRKKALTAAWIAQRQALSKIESAKNMEMKTALNKEKHKVASQLAELTSTARRSTAQKGLQSVLRRWVLAPQMSYLKRLQINFHVAQAQADTVQEAVQAATFETQLRMKQGEKNMQKKMDLVKQEAGLKMMRHVMKKMRNAQLAGWFGAVRAQCTQAKGGAAVEHQRRSMMQMKQALAESQKQAGVILLRKCASGLGLGGLRPSFQALLRECKDCKAKPTPLIPPAPPAVPMLQLQPKADTSGLEAELRASKELNVALSAQVHELEAQLEKSSHAAVMLQQSMKYQGYGHGMQCLRKYMCAIAAGSLRGAVLTWRVKLVGVPPTKKQLVARYKSNIGRKEQQPAVTRTPVKPLPSPATPGLGIVRRVTTHLKKGWMIGKVAEKADLTGQDLREIRAGGADLSLLELADANLSKASLEECELSGCNLANANLSCANLKGAVLKGADLRGANLREAVLDGAVLDGIDWTGTCLDYVSLHGTELDPLEWARSGRLRTANVGAVQWNDLDLSGMDLRGCLMNGSSLEGADLSNSNLTNASLKGASLLDAKLDGAEMKASNLTDAKMEGASLRGTNLTYARYSVDLMRSGLLKGSILGAIEMQGKDCQGVQLEQCNIVGGNFRKAFLISASLRGSNLSGADFAGANLRGADFAGCNLTNAMLKNAICLKDANLAGAVLDGSDIGGGVPKLHL